MLRLKDRTAVVTGGGKGIGAAFSHALASQGASVVVADIDKAAAENVAKQVSMAGGKSIACEVDVSDVASTKLMAELARSKFGSIDILVNNAAMFANLQRKPFDQISSEEFDRVLAVNVKGVWLCVLASLPSMRERKKGKVINIGSSSVFAAGNLLAHYLASKMAVIGLTRALARELGDHNICVNTLIPGATDSGSNQANTPRQYLESAALARSIKRIETPKDLVGALIFLASDDSDFMTGQSIVVDGGQRFN